MNFHSCGERVKPVDRAKGFFAIKVLDLTETSSVLLEKFLVFDVSTIQSVKNEIRCSKLCFKFAKSVQSLSEASLTDVAFLQQIILVCFLIAFAFAAPAPSDETVAGAITGDVTVKAEDLKQILLLLKLKPLLILG